MATRTAVFISSSAPGNAPAIAVFELDRATGALTSRGSASAAKNPSYLAASPNGRFLYCVCEPAQPSASKHGAVAGFAIDPATFALTPFNEQPSHGSGPCHLSVDATGRTLLVANYGSGSVASYPLRPDGSIAPAASAIQHHGSSVDMSRQEGPHAHSIYPDPGNRFALAVDLGLDQVLTYKLDPATSALAPATPPFSATAPGAGPRHMAFAPHCRHAYVINELNSTLSAYAYSSDTGSLTHVQTVPTLPPDWKGTNYPSDIHVSPDGRFVYGSNRGHESIAVFAIDPARGTLTPIAHEQTRGKWPRVFGLSPRGDFLLVANQHTHTVVVFRVDPRTGLLAAAGQQIESPAPACVKFIEFQG
ncbi:MAG: lactonase family protein [Planctomycetota bacterium]|nr:lactonase family protein [Planctomycetota bacterium]